MEKSSTCRQVLLFFSVGNIQYLHQMKLCICASIYAVTLESIYLMSSSSIITQTVTAIIKAFSVPITAKRKMRADSFTLLLCTCFYSFTSTIRFSSSSCFWSITDGASSITSRPLLFLGNAMQSRILSRPAKMLTQRSRPYARPP